MAPNIATGIGPLQASGADTGPERARSAPGPGLPASSASRHRLTVAPPRGKLCRLMAEDIKSSQQRILAAAKQLFLTKGFNGSNLRDIAREAKVSMGGIYHHFASKEEIYDSLLRASDIATDMLLILPLVRAPEFPQNLAQVGGAIAGIVRKHRDTFKLFYIDVLEFEGRHVKPLIQQFHNSFRDLSDGLLAHRKDDLIDMNPALLVRAMIALFLHSHLEAVMLEQPLADSLGMSDEDITASMAELLLRGVLRRS